MHVSRASTFVAMVKSIGKSLFGVVCRITTVCGFRHEVDAAAAMGEEVEAAVAAILEQGRERSSRSR